MASTKDDIERLALPAKAKLGVSGRHFNCCEGGGRERAARFVERVGLDVFKRAVLGS